MATALVEARLAACVGILPGMRSVYRWQGRIETATEAQLIIKTTADQQAGLIAFLRQHHPYELPEILALDVAGGLPDYLNWVADETRVPAHNPEDPA